MFGLSKIGEYSHLIQAGAVSRPFPRKIVCSLRRRIVIRRVHFWRFSSRENLSRNPTGLCIQRIRSYYDLFASSRFPWTTYETFHRGTFCHAIEPARRRGSNRSMKDDDREDPIDLRAADTFSTQVAQVWMTDVWPLPLFGLESRPKVRDCGRSGTQSGT